MLWVCYFSLVSLSFANKARFGAVLEEFEVQDALESVFYKEPDVAIF